MYKNERIYANMAKSSHFGPPKRQCVIILLGITQFFTIG